MKLKPKFKHNCKRCIYIETIKLEKEIFDIYICPKFENNTLIKLTIIGRYSNIPSEYYSFCITPKEYKQNNKPIADIFADWYK